jgi:hypothetical protein
MSEGRHSYVKFYPSDWLGGTARMNRTVRSVYHDVCVYIWDKAEPCPRAELVLMLSDLPDWEAIVQQLVDAKKLFWTDEGLSNRKAIAVAVDARDQWEKKSAGGKRARAGHQSSMTVASIMEDSCISPGNSAPQNQNQNQNHIDGGGGDARAAERDGLGEDAEPSDSVMERVREMVPEHPPSFGASTEAARWLKAGFDPELDIYPTIRVVMGTRHGRGPPKAPQYFTEAIQAAHERRISDLAPVNQSARRHAGKSSDVERLHAGLAAVARRMESGRTAAGDS